MGSPFTQPGDTGGMEATRVLVVEDDSGLRSALCRGLSEQGLLPVGVADGRSALEFMDAPTDGADVIVLDIGLPDSDGRDVCQALRARGVTAPVLFLTARGQVGDLISGFAVGGDDYLPKPFHFEELVARVLALARRSAVTRVQPVQPHLDPAAHSLVDGEVMVGLTPTEYRILAVLMGSRGRLVRRRELTSAAWPAGAIVHDNTLDQYVARIRRKTESLPSQMTLETVRGVGYQLV